jgi:hypothetical protein
MNLNLERMKNFINQNIIIKRRSDLIKFSENWPNLFEYSKFCFICDFCNFENINFGNRKSYSLNLIKRLKNFFNENKQTIPYENKNIYFYSLILIQNMKKEYSELSELEFESNYIMLASKEIEYIWINHSFIDNPLNLITIGNRRNSFQLIEMLINLGLKPLYYNCNIKRNNDYNKIFSEIQKKLNF